MAVIVDACGYHCPMNILMCRAALTRLGPHQEIQFVTTDRSSLCEIPLLVQALGGRLLEVVSSPDGRHRFHIRSLTGGLQRGRRPRRRERMRMTAGGGAFPWALA